MNPVEIRPGIYWVGINDRSTELFEGLWPIQDQGVSYNAYLVKDKKTALIDMSKEIYTDDFVKQVSALTDLSKLDYIILNHMEPDHTGVLTRLRSLAPKATIVGMSKAIEMVRDFYGITEGVQVVKHEEELNLGKYTLKFLFTPLLHWPETMMTFVKEQNVLFTCDGFGSYGALEGFLFDDEVSDIDFYEKEALRYFTNIVAAYCRNLLRAIDTVSGYKVEVIAPSHGLVWRKNPGRIISLYEQWGKWATAPAEPGVTVLYGTMYRNTERAMDAVLDTIVGQNVPVNVFNVATIHPSFILPSLWAKHGILVACPTYERAMFPAMVRMLYLADIKNVKNKVAGYFGSYAWSGGAKAVFDDFAGRLNWEVVGGLEFVGRAKEEDMQQVRQIAETVAKKSKAE
ncbi:MAG: FprA family A-type flavoprotein [Anaerolineaceae bacterium]|jgi:anaerobic nitric oxide reductase flavorubredoxin